MKNDDVKQFSEEYVIRKETEWNDIDLSNAEVGDIPGASEDIQDAIGTILTDSSTIDFTYDDSTPSITAIVKTDSINDTHIDWGTGANQVSTTDVPEGTSLYFTDERAQDAVGTILANTDTVDLTYVDGTPAITADVNTQMSITSDASGLKLEGDETSPGNNQVYGTDGSGVKGWKDDPAGSSSDSFKTISVSGQSDVVADSSTDTLTLAAGSNITITTNAGTDTITIAASGGGGIDAGTSFPGSPSDRDLFHRTDLDLICFYDNANSRWLTQQEYPVTYSVRHLQATAQTASFEMGYGIQPFAGRYNFQFTRLDWGFLMSAGTYNSTNHWAAAIFLYAGTTIRASFQATRSLGTHVANEFVGMTEAMTLLALSTDDAVRFNMTETGSPSSITNWYATAYGRGVIT